MPDLSKYPWVEGALSDAACVTAFAGATLPGGPALGGDAPVSVTRGQVGAAAGVLGVHAAGILASLARGDQPAGNTHTVETVRDRRQVPAWAS